MTPAKYLRFLISLFFIGLLCNCSNEPGAEVKPIQDGIDESYKPDHPIKFPHEVHSQVDCKLCHNSAADGKPGIPKTEVCMKCHKQADGNQTQEGM